MPGVNHLTGEREEDPKVAANIVKIKLYKTFMDMIVSVLTPFQITQLIDLGYVFE